MASYRLATLLFQTAFDGFQRKPAHEVALMFPLHVRLASTMMTSCWGKSERVLERVP